MKSLVKAFSLAAVIGFFAASCNTDPCKDVLCGDHGSCTEGVCNCETGYEKDADGLCNVESRAKFIGSFNADELCDTSTYNYIVNVSNNSTSITKFNITDLYLTGTSMVCDVDATGLAFTISNQTIATGLTATGSGTINANTRVVTVSYTISDGSASQSCSAILTPR